MARIIKLSLCVAVLVIFFPSACSAITADEITDSAMSHALDPQYSAAGDTTFCNEFIRDIVQDLLKQSRPELASSANEQYDQLSKSDDWEDLNFSADPAAVFAKAQDLANHGTLVLVALKNADGHGHIALVVPAPGLENSGAWMMKVPFIAQAGPKIAQLANKSVFASLKLSYGFKKADAPKMKVFRYKR